MGVAFDSVAELEQFMKGLANANRLELLQLLRTPRCLDALHLTPSAVDGRGTSRRPIAKQAVRRHVRTLTDLGILAEMGEEGSPSPRFCVDVARLFLFLEQLRGHVASLDVGQGEPVHGGSPLRAPAESFLPQNGSTRTLRLPEAEEPRIEGRRFEIVRGLREGVEFALDDEDPMPGETVAWQLGRCPQSDVRLDYDPYVSPTHARIVLRGGDCVLEDLPGNVNGTWHNWSRLEEGGRVRLRDGDVVGAGRSLLVYRE